MEQNANIARVVVDVPARALSEPLDYLVPAHLAGAVGVGCPVAVPLGGRRCVGYVVEIVDRTSFRGALKPIEAVLGMPVFNDRAPGLAGWIASEYVAPLSEALKLFLPPGGAPKVVRGPEGWVYAGHQMRPASERIVTLNETSGYVAPERARVQRGVLEALSGGPLTSAELNALVPGAAAALKALERAGAVNVVESRRYRKSAGKSAHAPRHKHSAEQANALRTIADVSASGGGVVLLDGVTASGKTEVYLAAIERAVSRGGGAIVLVPEISLTPQTVGRFRSRLGADVAVIHSRLSAGERFDQWQLALEGRVRVVVGARSALFAPVRDLALVVIDEEHEPSYKQGQSPRYHARDVAVRMCAEAGATLVLGSATPSMESLERARLGEYRHVQLTHRVGGGTPPTVEVVDMTTEFSNGNRSIYSRRLQEEIAGVVERGEKAVLFLNRRGFASFLLCRECGFVPECPSCSVSMTYHEDTGRLECHHCGATAPVPVTCPRCGSAYLRKFGAGTQRAEGDLSRLFPGLPIVRMDADTTSRKGGHEEALARFEETPGAVLLGTQMIAKGLDYPDVTLVGVLNADSSMNIPDFRAGERTYQLLEQVSGRAGRGERPGRVVLQTYWPDHPAVLAVSNRDAQALYESERAERASLRFPPYGRLANILFSGTDATAVRSAAMQAAAALKEGLAEGWEVVGPAPAPIVRLKGSWRWHMLLKGPMGSGLPEYLASHLERMTVPDGVTRIIDVDPVGML